MRILHLTNFIGAGGIESYVKSLAREQRKRGHDVGIAVCLRSGADPSAEVAKLQADGIWTALLDASSGHDARLPQRLHRAIREFAPGIIHASSTPILAAPPLLACRRPKILTIHLMEDGGGRGRIGNLLYRPLVTGVIAVSDAVYRQHREKLGLFPRARWKRIYNGIDLDRFSPASTGDNAPMDAAAGPVTLIMTCRMEADKHPEDAIRLLALLRKASPSRSFRLQLLGDGSMLPRLRDMACEMAVAGHVDFAGRQPDVVPFLRTSHGLLVLSEKETFSLSALEAMACGVPVFSYRVQGGFHELHADGKCGAVSAQRTPESLAETVLRAFDNPAEWQRYSRNARETAEQFSVRRMAADTLDFYAACCGKP